MPTVTKLPATSGKPGKPGKPGKRGHKVATAGRRPANKAVLAAILATLPSRPIHELSSFWALELLRRRARELKQAERRNRFAEARYRVMVHGVLRGKTPSKTTSADVVMEHHNAYLAVVQARYREGMARHYYIRLRAKARGEFWDL